LTDGERWILKKGFESYHTFDSLNALYAGLSDIQHCIDKESGEDFYVEAAAYRGLRGQVPGWDMSVLLRSLTVPCEPG